MLSLQEVLHNNERVILYTDAMKCLVYTWNRSCTLQVWKEIYDDGSPFRFEEMDIRTLSNEPKSFEEAESEIKNWHLARVWQMKNLPIA